MVLPCDVKAIDKLETINKNEFLNIRSFAEIQDKIDNKTLVLLDLDNTIIKSSVDYGSVEFFKALVYQARKEKCNKSQSIIEVYDRWIHSLKIIKTQLVDSKIYLFLKKIKKSNATVIIFTGRNPTEEIIKITNQQLNLYKLHFSSLPYFEKIYQYPDFPIPRWCLYQLDRCRKINKEFQYAQSKFIEGVLYSHVLNSKGTVFKEFFSNISNHKRFSKIIFVDDNYQDLESVATAAKELNLDFIGYHIQSENKNFDFLRALIQEKKLNNLDR